MMETVKGRQKEGLNVPLRRCALFFFLLCYSLVSINWMAAGSLLLLMHFAVRRSTKQSRYWVGRLSKTFLFLDITDLLCQHLSNGSVAIIYFTNTEKFGRSTAASQYFLQMAGFLGIPVIAWNADNAGLESVSTSSSTFRSSKNPDKADTILSFSLEIIFAFGIRNDWTLTVGAECRSSGVGDAFHYGSIQLETIWNCHQRNCGT